MPCDAVVSKSSKLDLEAIQRVLSDSNIDGWLFYYFHENDPLALRILKLDQGHFTRRWFYFIPKTGAPKKLVHRIEMEALDGLAGERIVYLGWKELEIKLKELLSGAGKVAMQYSPNNYIPYISRVDAGMIELVQSSGCKVVSSADLVQSFEAVLDDEQLKSHVDAGNALREIIFEAFAEIRRRINAKERVTEYDIQQFIVARFEKNNMTTNSDPIVAVNAHAGSPHYQPNATTFSDIKEDDFVLLDIWAKKKEPANAVYADITWTGFVGQDVPLRYTEIFNIVAGARDAALDFVKEAVANKRTIHGFEVDDVSRNYIAERGHGKDFVHRTGHSIGLEVHANGANIDNLETKDERRIIARTCFSIEPGIYLSDFGVRSEIDVYVGESEVLVAGQPIQTSIIPIMRDCP
jgi:Xaa-Pro aminopeptidase